MKSVKSHFHSSNNQSVLFWKNSQSPPHSLPKLFGIWKKNSQESANDGTFDPFLGCKSVRAASLRWAPATLLDQGGASPQPSLISNHATACLYPPIQLFSHWTIPTQG